MNALPSSLSLTEPAIVLAAFGTTVPNARRVYDRFESLVRRRFPAHSIRWTFTSQTVRKRLTEDGLEILDPAKTLEQIAREGHTAVVLQSLHITPGEEFTQLQSLTQEGLAIHFGKPLMYNACAIDRVLQLLNAEVRNTSKTVLVAHGNGRTTFDSWYQLLMDRVRVVLPEAVLASLEGFPGPTPLQSIKQQLSARDVVDFIPLLLVAGDHVLNDIMGEGSDSWKNQLGASQVTCAPPFGDRLEILEIFLEHLIDAVSQSKLGR